MRLFAYFAVKKRLKELTAKIAKNAKIMQRIEVRTPPVLIIVWIRCSVVAIKMAFLLKSLVRGNRHTEDAGVESHVCT